MFGELTEEQKLEKNVVKIFGEDKYLLIISFCGS